MAMLDINGEEFFVGDTLKVIKGDYGFEVGDLVVCHYDDDSDCCRFGLVGGHPVRDAYWINNKRLQKL